MSNLKLFPNKSATREATREDAALWIARMDRGLTPSERTELDHWLNRPGNRRVFAQMQDTWDEADDLSTLAFSLRRTLRDGEQKQQTSRRRRWPAIAASILIALAITGLAGHHFFVAQPKASYAKTVQEFSTVVGEHRSITLSDGSLVTLNTDTRIEIHYSAAMRQLRLTRGEAHFEVAHDKQRPFIVEVEDRAVRAVGTAFDIRMRPNQALDVFVTAGTIQVLHSRMTDTVTAGKLWKVDHLNIPSIVTVDSLKVDRALAWRRGILIFDGETLGTAIDEILRYTTTRIVVDDSLRSIPIGGYFPTNDINALLQALTTNFDIDMEPIANGFRLRPAKHTSAQRI
jgi:transmembrane sensor